MCIHNLLNAEQGPTRPRVCGCPLMSLDSLGCGGWWARGASPHMAWGEETSVLPYVQP